MRLDFAPALCCSQKSEPAASDAIESQCQGFRDSSKGLGLQGSGVLSVSEEDLIH